MSISSGFGVVLIGPGYGAPGRQETLSRRVALPSSPGTERDDDLPGGRSGQRLGFIRNDRLLKEGERVVVHTTIVRRRSSESPSCRVSRRRARLTIPDRPTRRVLRPASARDPGQWAGGRPPKCNSDAHCCAFALRCPVTSMPRAVMSKLGLLSVVDRLVGSGQFGTPWERMQRAKCRNWVQSWAI